MFEIRSDPKEDSSREGKNRSPGPAGAAGYIVLHVHRRPCSVSGDVLGQVARHGGFLPSV